MEDNGYGDRLQDYQGSMPIFNNDELKTKPFCIDILFDYNDKKRGGSTEVWCQGNVTELVKEKLVISWRAKWTGWPQRVTTTNSKYLQQWIQCLKHHFRG